MSTYTLKVSFERFTTLWFIDIRKTDIAFVNNILYFIETQKSFHIPKKDEQRLKRIARSRKDFIYERVLNKYRNELINSSDKQTKDNYRNLIKYSTDELKNLINKLIDSFERVKSVASSLNMLEGILYSTLLKMVDAFSINDLHLIEDLFVEKNAILLLYYYWYDFDKDKNLYDIEVRRYVAKNYGFEEESFFKSFEDFFIKKPFSPFTKYAKIHPNVRKAYTAHYKYVLRILKKECPAAYEIAEKDSLAIL